ncbi:MAG: hypothetical protein LEGION0403_FIIPPAGN_01787 [Legionella sp.]|uniref:AAA family ATPase n=1 Tax=Legionella sp. TaxID=459 RepID=UPI003D0BDEB2
MAIYHYHREIGKRSAGKNAVFGAAYIRGEKRTCDRTGETKDFSDKPAVVYKNTFLPVDAPTWALSLRNSSVIDSEGKKHADLTGEQFSTYAWNQIEFAEKRVDSQIYFHEDYALPNALTKEQAIELVDEFVTNHLAIHGVFCDVAIHWDENNHHFHVLMPMRALTDEGFSKKIRRSKSELAHEVNRIREAWAVCANDTMHALGINERIDHRSYEARGIDLIPTVKVGKFGHFPDQSIALRKLQENELIKEVNTQAIQNNPAILSCKILQEHTVFDSDAVVHEINRHVILEQLHANEEPIGEYSDPIIERLLQSIQTEDGIFNERALKRKVLEQVRSEDEFQRIYTHIISHEHIISLGLGEDGREHYVGRSAFDLENNLLKTTHALSLRSTFKVSKRLVRTVGAKYGLNAAQQRALYHLTRSGNVAVVCGYAGTGKTYMLKAAKEIWEQSGYNLVGVATAGKAASGLEIETGINSKTIYGFIRAVQNNTLTVDENTILIMDEMGMTSLDDMSAVLNIVRERGAKFAGVGDIEQTQPVGRGAPQRAMVELLGAVYLDTIIRQKVEWQRQATTYFETNQTALGFDLYERHGCVHLHQTDEQAKQELIDRWYTNYRSQNKLPLSEFIMAAFKNETVNELNRMARATLVAHGLLEQGTLVTTETGAIPIAVHDRLVFTENNSKFGVKNGSFATVLSFSAETNQLTVQLDGGAQVNLDCTEYRKFTYAYASTVHKLQGHTATECHVLVDGQGWDRHKFLVAATRHKQSLTIHASGEQFNDLAHLKETVSRHGLNDVLTDFPVTFAERRGFDVEFVATKAALALQTMKRRVFSPISYLFNYQTALEQGTSSYELSLSELESRRRDAVIVAEFCDNRQELAALLNEMKTQNDLDKTVTQGLVYAIQQRNGAIAAKIEEHPERYAMALERNRVTREHVAKAFKFHQGHQLVASLLDQQQKAQTVAPEKAFELAHQLKAYYGHVCQQLPDKEARTAWLLEMELSADIYRRTQALDSMGLGHRPLINAVTRYKALDQSIGAQIKALATATALEKSELYRDGVLRDKLAYELAANPHFEKIIAHFALQPERVQKHADKYRDRQYVKTFAEYEASSKTQGNLIKQTAAHRIKSEPKRFGIYVDEFLSEGWKSINIENWLYEQRKTIAQGSPALKSSIRKVRQYKVAASSAYGQWQKAIARSQKDSPHKNKGFKHAQGLSWKRSLLAHELMSALPRHVAALSMEKVDTNKLYRQALSVDYLNRYRAETRETLKLRMAHHINEHIKEFQAGLAVFGLYQEVKEYAAHFSYLKRIKEAPEQEIKSLIRLALDYQEKKREAGLVWGQVKALKQLNIDTHGLERQAKQLMNQRNAAAHAVLSACSNQEWLTKKTTGINLEVSKLQREAGQHEAHTLIMRYLAAPQEIRESLASTILTNKAGYHLVFAHNLSFETLTKEAKRFEQARHLNEVSQNTDKPVVAKQRPALWDIERITQALMNNPIDTYTAILGQPKHHKTNHLRFDGAIVVATKGSDAGKWYSFTEEVGGGPISAMQKYLNLSFPEALAYGASLAGLSDFEAKIAHDKILPVRQEPKPVAEPKVNKGLASAQSIWNGAHEASGSIAERYFVEHRKIDDINGMEIRYWPKGAAWVDFDEQGAPVTRVNKLPAALIAGRNAQGEVECVQRIYLDEKTAGKNTFLKDAKLTKGSNKGAPGVIQTGTNGILYIAEGPETGATIARFDRDATVLVSFSVSNIANMVEVIQSHNPTRVYLAADNDGEHALSRITTEKACATLRAAGIDVRLVYPNALPEKQKTDWNDLVVVRGQEAFRVEFKEQLAKTQFLYEKASPCAGTLGENFFKTTDTSLDLSDVRFVDSIAYKGQKVPALLAPRTNSAGLLCGETVYALSADGKKILSEGTKKDAPGFYMAQRGTGEMLIIAESLLNAKLAVQRNPQATVVLSKFEEHGQLQHYLSEQKIHPTKVAVVSERCDRDQQIRIAHSCARFIEAGAELYLTNQEARMTQINHESLEKSRLKMSFEKLVSLKPAVVEAVQTPQERLNQLTKEHPMLKQYEQDSKARLKVTGFAREQMEKQLNTLAKELAKDKHLIATLQKELPQLAHDIKHRTQNLQKHPRGIK